MGKQSPLLVKIEEEKNESAISSFAGVATFLEFLSAFRFAELFNGLLPDKSEQGYSSIHYALTIILMNLTGGQSVSDVEAIEEDNGLKRVFKSFEGKISWLKNRVFRKGRSRTFPSISRIFDFLARFNSPDEEAERESTPQGTSKILPVGGPFEDLVELNARIIARDQSLDKIETATLDMDNNVVESNKSTAKISYKKTRSYQPFNVYWHEKDLMLFTEFRDGNVPAGLEQLRVLEESLRLLPKGVKAVKVRSDSAGYQREFLEYMEKGTERFGKIEFSVSCDVTKPFRQAVQEIPEEEWAPIVYTDENGYRVISKQEVAEVCFVPETRNHKKDAPVFRYLATREATDIHYEFDDNGQISIFATDYVEGKLHLEEMEKKIYKVFGIVTNQKGTPLDIVLDHRKRCGRSEKEHSRLTTDMAGGRFPSASFGENAAWWYLSVISLNLLKLFQRHALPKELRHSRIKTLSARLFRIAIKVVKKSGRLVVRIGQGHSLTPLMSRAQAKIVALDRRLSSGELWLLNQSPTY
jgi:hypothetical protein